LMVDLEAWRKPRRERDGKFPADEEEEDENDEDDLEEGDDHIEEDDEEADITHNDDVMEGLDNEELNDHFFFLNYFVVKRAEKKKLQPWEIEKRFSLLPNYTSKEKKKSFVLGARALRVHPRDCF